MHAKDVAEVIKQMIEKDKFLNMNIATSENFTVDKIARIALKACNQENMQIKYDKKMPNGQLRKDIDISKFKENFPNFNPITLFEGIKEIFKREVQMSKTLLFGGSGFFGPVILAKDPEIISVGRTKPQKIVKINTFK